MIEKSYKKICSQINIEWEKIQEPSLEDITAISKKLKVSKDIVRECLGFKDYYDFCLN